MSVVDKSFPTCDTEADLVNRLRLAMDGRRFLRAPLYWTDQFDRTVRQALSAQVPLRALLLWGRGPKQEPDRAEEMMANLLRRYEKAIKPVWPAGLQYLILFADTHAAANGYESRESHRYFAATRSLLGAECFKFGLLSDAWHFGGLTWGRVQEYADSLSGPAWEELALDLGLFSAAAKYARRPDPQASARQYFAARVLENQLLSRIYDGYIYATSDAPERRLLCPDLPALHMYSFARGRCAKPWFVTMPHESQVVEAVNRCAA